MTLEVILRRNLDAETDDLVLSSIDFDMEVRDDLPPPLLLDGPALDSSL
jgi:hypothetical protein